MTAQQSLIFDPKMLGFHIESSEEKKPIKAYVYMLPKANIPGQIILKDLKCILII